MKYLQSGAQETMLDVENYLVVQCELSCKTETRVLSSVLTAHASFQSLYAIAPRGMHIFDKFLFLNSCTCIS